MADEFTKHASEHAPSLLGSLTALLLKWKALRGYSWPEVVGMGLAGWAAAAITAEWLSSVLHMPQGVVGYLVGMLSMAIAAKVFELIDVLNIGPLVMEWIRKRMGLQ